MGGFPATYKQLKAGCRRSTGGKAADYVDAILTNHHQMAQSRRRQLEKLEITEAPKDETNQLKFRFEYDVEPWNELVMLKNLTIKIGDRTLLEPFTYTVCRGQRLIIAGPNGAGKSTLMQVLDGKRRPSGGMVRLGTGARPSILPSSRTVWDRPGHRRNLETSTLHD